MSIDLNKSNSINKDKLLINNIKQYEMGEKIGEGTFGKVIVASHKITKEKVAIKILDKFRISKKDEQIRINREIEALKKINHYNIIKLYTIIENDVQIYIIQEYINGNELFEYIKNNKKLTEKEACIFYQQIISGIEYLHKLGIAHRDLKPENILLTDSKVLKIIDFGLSILYEKNDLLKTQCGSPCYAPPEMIEGKHYKGLAADIWSSGIILFFMLSGYLPFNELTNKKLYNKILNGKYNIPKDISNEAKDLIKKILEINPKKRIKINEIKEHPWFNMVNRMFNMHVGIDLKKTVMPIDEEIIEKMNNIGFIKMQVRDSILRNLHNNISTTYYLFLGKKVREGRESFADLYSYMYERYMEDKENEMSNFDNDIINVLKQRISSKGKIEKLPNYNTCENNIHLKRKRKYSETIDIGNHIDNKIKFINEYNEKETPLISTQRNNNLSLGKISNDLNDLQIKSSFPSRNIKIIKNYKKQKNYKINKLNINNNLNKIKLNLNKQTYYADSEPNVKSPNNIVLLNIIHQQRNKSIENEKIKFSIIKEMKKTHKNKYKSLNNSERNNSINNTILVRKNNNKINVSTFLSGELFKKINKLKNGIKNNFINENSLSKKTINIINKENKNFDFIKKIERRKTYLKNDNNKNIRNNGTIEKDHEIHVNKHKPNSVKSINKIKINLKLKKKLTNQIKSSQYTKLNNNLLNGMKHNSTKNINNKNTNINLFSKDKFSKTINKDENEINKVKNIKVIKLADINDNEKYINKSKKNIKNENDNNTEEQFIPFDISMIFTLKKQQIIQILKNFFIENNIKFKKITTNNNKFLCTKNDLIAFEIILDKNKIFKNISIRLRIIKGEKKFYADLIKSINFLLQ